MHIFFTLCCKKTLYHCYFCNIFGLCWPVLTILSPLQSDMIRAHVWNNICHHSFTAALPDKNCAVNINISYIFLQYSNECLSNDTKQVAYSKCVFIWCARNDQPSYEQPPACSGVVRIDPLRFLAGCRRRRLNQVYLCLSYILACFIVLLFIRAPFVYC